MAMVLSRSEPSAALARLHANDSLEVIRGGELALTEREARDIAGLWGYSGRDRDTVLALHARTEGWAAGLVLLLAGWRSGAGERRRGGDEQTLLDYFAQEVLDRSDPDTQRVLLETALLPSIQGSMAVHLTGIERAEEILSGLSRRGCFVARHDASYQYQALFREFLLGRAAKMLSPERRAQLQRSAAGLLEDSGHAEDAFPPYIHAGAWADATRIVRSQAPLLLRQGRAETVAQWVGCLPEEVRDRDPWLLQHLGEALSILKPRAALVHLERAFDLFRAAADCSGAYLAWAAIAETQSFALQELAPLDRWIPALEDLRVRFPNFGGPEVEARLVAAAFAALTHRQPWHPALRSWEERALSLALSPGDPYLRMKIGRALVLYYGGWVMDLTKARLVIDALGTLAVTADADPSTAIFWHIGDALHHLFLCRLDACHETVNRDAFVRPAECHGALAQGVLALGAFGVLHDLPSTRPQGRYRRNSSSTYLGRQRPSMASSRRRLSRCSETTWWRTVLSGSLRL
jgi:hypothetical protein